MSEVDHKMEEYMRAANMRIAALTYEAEQTARAGGKPLKATIKEGADDARGAIDEIRQVLAHPSAQASLFMNSYAAMLFQALQSGSVSEDLTSFLRGQLNLAASAEEAFFSLAGKLEQLHPSTQGPLMPIQTEARHSHFFEEHGRIRGVPEWRVRVYSGINDLAGLVAKPFLTQPSAHEMLADTLVDRDFFSKLKSLFDEGKFAPIPVLTDVGIEPPLADEAHRNLGIFAETALPALIDLTEHPGFTALCIEKGNRHRTEAVSKHYTFR